jgi:apolipoprotein D and lipocalin family protein
MNIKHRVSLATMHLLTAVSLTGCTAVPNGVRVVAGFELDRYLGTWYEIARYRMRDGGGVSVVNRGYNVAKGKWQEATGKAYFVGESNLGQLKVSFFGPFYGGYNIIELDKDNYQYTLVAGPDRDYLWILSRTPELGNDVLSALVNKAEALNFPVDELIYVDHTGPE